MFIIKRSYLNTRLDNCQNGQVSRELSAVHVPYFFFKNFTKLLFNSIIKFVRRLLLYQAKLYVYNYNM